jgi:type IV pilus assembly protein PilB
MNCEEVRDELVAFAREELDPARMAAIQEHLSDCKACRRELAGAQKVMTLTRIADEASVTDLVQELIRTAIRDGASDIHVEKGNGTPRVRFRIDGVLHLGPALAPEHHEPLVARIKAMAEMNIAEKRVPQDGRIRFTEAEKEYDLRVNVCPFFNGEGVVMRILDRTSVLVGLPRLGFSPKTLAQVEAMIARNAGMILTTGPTGAGKSTLLYSMLLERNRPEVKILTIEDPVEYHFPGLNQMAVRKAVGVTPATAMRALLRQDPDIFMVSEFRDLETAELSAQAAMTGHLVLGALHTPDATSALTRLLQMGMAPFIIAATLVGVIGQRLVRRVCTECRESYQPAEKTLEALGFTRETGIPSFTRGAGCDRCAGSGFKGRTGLFEVLTLNDELARMIVEGASESDIRRRATDQGALWPFLADARAKIAEGITTAEEVERKLLELLASPTVP